MKARRGLVKTNEDTFNHSVSETAGIYSPETIAKGASSVNSTTAATSTASTDRQRRNIPTLLAAKMAGLKTDYLGGVIVSGKSDADALNRAYATIHGDHPRLSYNSAYRYSQSDPKNPYKNPEPKVSCCTFAFATALSIMYHKEITPDKIKTVEGHGYVDDETAATSIWTTKDSKYKAYKIVGSSGSETLGGIDAQLQLGNPVLIHTDGKDSKGQDSEHWATVIGKENGRYRIIDPWDGTERWLEDMEIYKNGGSILEYTILSDKY